MDSLVQNNVRGKMRMRIRKDPWLSFISEYEWSNVKVNKSKWDIPIENSVIRKDVSFIRISN